MRKQKSFKRKLGILILRLAALGAIVYGALIGWVYVQEVSVPEAKDYDSIIVLGAQVLPSGEPSVQLRWRMDAARKVYDRNPCPLIVTGGKAGQEPVAEGDLMRSLFIAEGVPEEHVVSDPESVNTKENLRNAWQILQELGRSRPVVVTSDYHLPRAVQIMKDMGIEAQGVGSPCKPGAVYFLKNHMREALAWVKYWGLRLLGQNP